MLRQRSSFVAALFLSVLCPFPPDSTAQLCVPDLTADANGDCVVDPLDSGFVLGRFSCPVGTGDAFCDAADVNGDGAVDPLDSGYVLSRFCGGGTLPSVAVEPINTPTSDFLITLSGSSIGATTVEVAGGVELVTVSVGECMWSVDVELVQNAVNSLFVTGISGEGVRGTPYPVSITNDLKAPEVFIDFPSNGMELTTDVTDVAGRVSDTLSGFAGLGVMVNGRVAAVDEGIGTNGTFFVSGLDLALGNNVITATATDLLGNNATTQIIVQRVEIPDDVPVMTVLAGNAQTGTVHTWLPQPITVQVNKADGTPFANKVVTFDVTRNDGRLAADPRGEGSLMFQAHTDDFGMAQAWWRLGGTAGSGSDRICVTSTSIVGTAFFCATAVPGPAHHINIGSGNNLRAEVNGPAPEPLRIWINDQCNGVADVPVTFTVTQGGGYVNGQSNVTVNTDDTGHAEVNFILGPEPGNQRVEATFEGNQFSPATFVIVGVERDEFPIASFTGLVIDNASRPLGGAGVQLLVAGQEAGTAVSDENGQFTMYLVENALSGEADVYIDGDAINSILIDDVPTHPETLGVRFPDLHYNTQIIAGAANTLPAPVKLPPLSAVNDRVYFGNQTTDLELTCEGIDGLKMIVKAGTTITLPDGTHVGPDYPGSSVTLGLNQVHHEDVPMPMTDGASPPFAWTLQPAGAKFDPPVQVEYPNMTGLPAGGISNFLSFNHTTNKFEIVATGTVSADGSLIRSDSGDGIDLSGWGCNCPPYSVTATCDHPSDSCSARADKCTCYATFDVCHAAAFAVLGFCLLVAAAFAPTVPAFAAAVFICLGYASIEVFKCHAELGICLAAPLFTDACAEDDPIYNSLISLLPEMEALLAQCPNFVCPVEIEAQMTELLDEANALAGGDALAYLTEAAASCALSGIAANPYNPFDESWSFTVGGQTANPNGDGSFIISNAASPDSFGAGGPGTPPDFVGDDYIQMLGTTTALGVPWYAFTDYFQLTQGQTYVLTAENFTITDVPPLLPVSLEAVAQQFVLATGSSTKLTTTALLADGSPADVSLKSDWTTYRISNPSVLCIDEVDDGKGSMISQITALAVGTAFITATNGGATAIERIDVISETVTTTVEGFVHLDDGSPVEGAVVTSSQYGGLGISAGDGHFSLVLVIPPVDSINVSAEALIDGHAYQGAASAIPVVANGISDSGIITLRPAITVLFGNPEFGAGDFPYSVAIGDLNGDGDADLVIANNISDNVSVLMHNGDGTFADDVLYGAGDGPISVAIADLDGDGDADLIVANLSSSNVSVLLNQGDGTFANDVLYGAGTNPYAVAIGDLDGDGDADVTVPNYSSDNVSVLFNQGNGTFADDVLYGVGDGPRSIAAADLDGDDDLDLVTANEINDNVSVLLNNSNGTFATHVLYGAGNGPYSVAIGDLDGDADADLAVANYNTGNVSVLLNQGAGTFADDVLYGAEVAPISVAISDLDGDGDADLAVGNSMSDNVSVLLGEGDGTFAADVVYGAGFGTRGVAIGNLDGDGDADLAVASGNSDVVAVLLNQGDGTFGADVLYGAGDGPQSVAIADLDGDGDADLAVANSDGLGGSDEVSVLLNQGEGNFANDVLYGVGNGPKSVAVGDLNEDGDIDLAVANFDNDNVSVLLNQGGGTFAADLLYGAGDGPQSVAVGDLDEDGDADLSVANYISDNVSVLLNNGDGTFAADVLYGAGDGPSSVAIGDLDGDGDADLAVANSLGDNVSVLLNQGNGTFADDVLYGVGDQPTLVAIYELDELYNADLAVANYNSDNVSVLLNQGNGTFADDVLYSAGDGPQSVAIGDLDGDGKADLAVANVFSANLSVLIHQEYAVFGPDSFYGAGAGPVSTALGDLDGDGDADLVTANSNGDNVSVLFNRRIE